MWPLRYSGVSFLSYICNWSTSFIYLLDLPKQVIKSDCLTPNKLISELINELINDLFALAVRDISNHAGDSWMFSWIKTHRQEVGHVQSDWLVPRAEDDFRLWFRLRRGDGRLRRRRARGGGVGGRRTNGWGDWTLHIGHHCRLHPLDRCGGGQRRTL